jgi:hypothetical protein
MLGLTVVRPLDQWGTGVVKAASISQWAAAISLLQHSPLALYAGPVGVGRKNDVPREYLPNDPYFRGTAPANYAYQWYLRNTGQSPPNSPAPYDQDIDAPEGWTMTFGSNNVAMAIVDSGIAMSDGGTLNHPDLRSGRIVLK